MPKKLTQKRLREVLRYNRTTGEFFWQIQLSNRRPVGSLAGNSTPRGYWQICIDYRRYLIHRLAWLYVYGHFPKGELDHVNRKKSDNRIKNLRPLGKVHNQANRDFSNRGAYQTRYGWIAQICHKGRRRYLGTFATKAEAQAVYRREKKRLVGRYLPT